MKRKFSISRVLYIGFLVFGLFKIVMLNFGEGAIFMGVALAFDPFDAKMMWNNRPFWQKAWLLVHLGVCAASLGLEIGIKG